MDLAKTGVSFAIGAVVTYGVINRLDERRQDERFLGQTLFNLRLNAVNTFREASLAYFDAAQDGYLEMARTSVTGGAERTEPIRRYEDTSWVAFQSAIEGLRMRLPEQTLGTCLQRLEEINDQRHQIYQEAWIGWISTGSSGERWRIGGQLRPKYDDLLATLQQHRVRCVDIAEKLLAQGVRPR